MKEFVIRFIVGGAVVSVFAMFGDALQPKSFAGLFGAAPSVALATLGLTIYTKGPMYASTEARSMVAGAVAFFLYASWVSWWMMRYKGKALRVTAVSIVLWLAASLGFWRFFLRDG